MKHSGGLIQTTGMYVLYATAVIGGIVLFGCSLYAGPFFVRQMPWTGYVFIGWVLNLIAIVFLPIHNWCFNESFKEFIQMTLLEFLGMVILCSLMFLLFRFPEVTFVLIPLGIWWRAK